MTVDRPNPWHADLPELDDDGRRVVLGSLLDTLTYRNVTRDDVREAYRMATDPDAVLTELAQWADHHRPDV